MAVNPTFGFATLAEVKNRVAITGTSLDDVLNELILSVSGVLERVAQRRLRRPDSDVTEYYSGGSRMIQLNLSPIASITNIRESAVRDFTTSGQYTELTATTDYIYHPGEEQGQSGILDRVDQDWLGDARKSPGQIRVVYNGGYLNDEEDTFPIPQDLRDACITQVAHELEQRRSPGRISDAMRGVSIASGTANMHQPMDLLPLVHRIALGYRRIVAF